MDSNIEKLILDMHSDLATRVDRIGDGMNKHEVKDESRFGQIDVAFARIDKALSPLQETQRTTKWVVRTLAGALLVGMVAMGFDLAKNHMVMNVPPKESREK
jgi:hypothetical protein